MSAAGFAYQPYWCEENVWHLLGRDDLGPGSRRVVFVSNEQRQVALWQQKASREPDGLVVWDYHVVLLVGDMLWDLDTRLPCPTPASRWLDATFRPLPAGPDHAPRFRVIEADAFRRAFASDRRHMLDEHGLWRAPPPPWATIGSGHNLPQFIDMEAAFLGELHDLVGLRGSL